MGIEKHPFEPHGGSRAVALTAINADPRRRGINRMEVFYIVASGGEDGMF